MDNAYQCYVLTNYILYIKYTSICRLRYKLLDSKGDNKTNYENHEVIKVRSNSYNFYPDIFNVHQR